MTKAEEWHYMEGHINPTLRIEKNKEKQSQQRLSDQQLENLGSLLRNQTAMASEHPSVRHAIKLLLLTGFRKSEALTLKWDYVDFDGKCVRFPDSKTGPKQLPLNPSTLAHLSGLKANSRSEYVFPGKKMGRPLVNLQQPWKRICRRLGFKKVRIHDLRHTFASKLADLGYSIPMIAALLGHKNLTTTARYTHLSTAPISEATSRVGTNIANLIDPNHEPDRSNIETIQIHISH